jgi:cytochrome c551
VRLDPTQVKVYYSKAYWLLLEEIVNRRWFKLTLITLLVIFLAACGGSGTPTSAPPPQEEGGSQEELASEEIDAAAIFSTRCARCHGADRSGKNGPALLPERLTQNSSVYEATITTGSGPMPAFDSLLSADEISALVVFILSDPQ